MVKTVAEDPLGFLDSITQLVEILDKWGLLDEIIRALPQSIQEKQELNNPYDKTEQPTLYQRYRVSWYGGYASYFVVSALAGGQVTKALKNSKRLGDLVDTLDSGGKIRKFASYYSRGKRAVAGPPKTAGTLVVRGVVKGTDLGASSARRTLGAVQTTGRKITVASRLRRLDPDTVDNLDASEQTRLGESLAGSGDDGARLIADGGEDLLEYAIREGGIDESVAARLRQLDAEGEFTDADLQRLGRQLGDGDIDQDGVRRMASILETKDFSPLFDEDVTASNLLDAVEDNGDPSKMLSVAKPEGSTNTVWLERGDRESGWIHIRNRLDQFERKSALDITTEEDLKKLVYETVEDGDAYSIPKNDGGGTAYVRDTTNGDMVTVITGDNGYIVTSYPGPPRNVDIS